MADYNQILKLLKSDEEIHQAQVLKWMESDDIRALGAVYELTEKAWSRIKPEIEMEDMCNSILKYLTKCIIEDPDDDILYSRYEAGHLMAMWIIHLYTMTPKTNRILKKVIKFLEELYTNGDRGVQDGVINGVLEHIFEEKKLVNLFQDWLNNPKLKYAYDEALKWGKDYWDSEYYSSGLKKQLKNNLV